jgi:DNA helicase-2/ATP-dependent DNA helicase PcrA
MTDAEEGRFVAGTIFEQKMQNQIMVTLPFYIVPMHNLVRWKMRLENEIFLPHLWWIVFYQRKEIKDVLCYLRLVINPKDEEA